jgi:glycosyltransferase involved in cell wall biosynthesis
LGVHEALCSGTPAIASACSGVAEKYPAELRDLLLANPDDAGRLADGIVRWMADRVRYRGILQGVSQSLRSWTWDHMAEALVRAAEGQTGPEMLKLSA